jgi:hypothetical protein
MITIADLEWKDYPAKVDAANRNRPASQSATDAEFRKIHDLCEKVADHLEKIHEPAVSALWREGLSAMEMAGQLRAMMEVTRHAFGSAEGRDVKGRQKDIEARGGTYEIAVMRNGHIDYSTPITDNVLGYLSEDEANAALAAIGALPAE